MFLRIARREPTFLLSFPFPSPFLFPSLPFILYSFLPPAPFFLSYRCKLLRIPTWDGQQSFCHLVEMAHLRMNPTQRLSSLRCRVHIPRLWVSGSSLNCSWKCLPFVITRTKLSSPSQPFLLSLSWFLPLQKRLYKYKRLFSPKKWTLVSGKVRTSIPSKSEAGSTRLTG